MGATIKLQAGSQGVTLARRLKKYRNACAKNHVVAGYIRGISSSESIKKAVLNEFGHPKVPARPFMAQSIPFIKENIEAIAEDLHPSRIGQFLTMAGESMKMGIQESISSQNFAPLSKNTIRKKGHGIILIDTGMMFDDPQSQTRKGVA